MKRTLWIVMLCLILCGCATYRIDDVIVDQEPSTADLVLEAKNEIWFNTSCGIRVKANRAAIEQYSQYHALPWDKVDWERLCLIWKTQRGLFEKAGVDVSKATPKGVDVVIQKWALVEVAGYGTKPRVLIPGDGYAQAYFLPGSLTIGMSLSLDSGQGPEAMCVSPYRHEVNHAILKKARHKCWALGERGSKDCVKWDLYGKCP